ncbi:MAG: hypothetical protein HY720_06740 [Planctomycetes bacterium]|nr:hypothetical protein [Planctomycetota bacterium]
MRTMETTARNSEDLSLRDRNAASGWACAVSGLLVGIVAGAGIAVLVTGSPQGPETLFGIGLGAFLGLLFGRKIAAMDTIPGGIVTGAFLPIGLCLLDGIRSGKLARVSANELADPRTLTALGTTLAIGGTIGGLLVGLRKLIDSRGRRGTQPVA